jgi:L-threonylcarbamoyladenylate synthase
MSTRVLFVDPIHPEAAAIQLAAECVRAGRLVAFPTETVYGLGANALDAEAVQRIFAAKGRPPTDPLIVHIRERAQLEAVAVSIPDLAHELAERFWPGPLTLILPRHPRVPSEVAAGGPTVAVRVPNHPVALALLEAAGVPIAAPSANRFMRPSPTTAQHVLDDLEGSIDLLLDAGPAPIGLESTILDVTQNPPVILRPGGAPLEALKRLIPEVTLRAQYRALDADSAPAPGSFLKHYSPRAELRLFDGPRDRALTHMQAEARSLAQTQRRVGLLLVDEDLSSFADLPAETARLGPEADSEEVGRRLFAGLRDLDGRGVEVILARVPAFAGMAREGLGLAIWDRLFRAAEGRVLNTAGDDE